MTLPGDYNGDGVVASDEYQVWRTILGDTTALLADGNGNNVVDTSDYLTWRKNQGRTWQDLSPGSGAGVGGGTVPEPTAAVLAMLASFCTLILRRRDRAR